MNPYLSMAIILILRWLQAIASYQVLGPSMDRTKTLAALLQETTDFTAKLEHYTLISNGMSDTEIPKKVM